MTEPKDIDIKIGIGRPETPSPEPVDSSLEISVGQLEVDNLFLREELPSGTKEAGAPRKDLVVSLFEGQALQQIFDYMQAEKNREREREADF